MTCHTRPTICSGCRGCPNRTRCPHDLPCGTCLMAALTSPNQLCLPLPEENSGAGALSIQHQPKRRKRKGLALEQLAHPTKLRTLVEEHHAQETSHSQIPEAPAEVQELKTSPFVDTQSDKTAHKSKRALLQRIWGRLVALLLAAALLPCWPYIAKTIEGIKVGVDLWGIVRDIGHNRRDEPKLPSEKYCTNPVEKEWRTSTCYNHSARK